VDHINDWVRGWVAHARQRFTKLDCSKSREICTEAILCGSGHIGTAVAFTFASARSSIEGADARMNAYVPILVLGAVAVAFAVFSVMVGTMVGPARYNRAKFDAYECGIEPTMHAPTGQRFPVKFYLTAMLFIIFDIEIVFLYPWAVHLDVLGAFGLVAMALFVVNVSVAYVYEWRRGGLGWD
jgi:NADH-quinone oxidoreductase subunit A